MNVSISGKLENASTLPKIILKDLVIDQHSWILISSNVVIQNCRLKKMDFTADLAQKSQIMNVFINNSEIAESSFLRVDNATICQSRFGISETNQIVFNATKAKISDSLFTNQSVPGPLFRITNGGFVHVEQNNFTYNSAQNGIFSVTHAKLKIENCLFIHNRGFYSSSCIQAYDGSHINISHGIFKGNTGYFGGVLFAQNQVSVTVNHTRFEGNSAEMKGGVIFLNAYSMLLSTDSFYINNSAIGGQSAQTVALDVYRSTRHQDYYSKASEDMTMKLQKMKQTKNHIKHPRKTKAQKGTDSNVTNMQHHSSGQMQNQYGGKSEGVDNVDNINDQWQNNRWRVNKGKEELQFNGGAILLGKQVKAFFRKDEFTENKARWYGGAIYAEYSVNHSYTDCIFLKNVAEQNCAGAILSDVQSNLLLKRCTFESNSAGDSGGALLSALYSTAEISDNSFIGNSALKGAGAIWNLDNAKLIVRNTTFDGNYVTRKVSFGGALITFRWATAWLDNTYFNNNKAKQSAGGIGVSFHSGVSIVNSLIEGNFGGQAGGGLLLYEYCWANITNTTFRRNSAKDLGSSIGFGQHAKLQIMHVSISESYPVGRSGIIYGTDSISMNMTFTNITKNTVPGTGALLTFINHASVTISHSNINQNSGGQTKVLVAHSSNILMKSCKFINNTSEQSGAVSIVTDSHGAIYDSEFINNKATGSSSQGGAIYIAGSHFSSLDLQRTIFKQNSAVVQGGAILAAFGAILTAEKCDFEGNFGVLYGGAVRAITNVCVSLISCNFSNNSAVNGGALASEDKTNVCIDSCILNENTAAKKGGVLYIAAKDTETRISHTSFYNNTAPKGNDLEYAYLDNSNHTTRTFKAKFWMNGRWLSSNNANFLTEAKKENTIRVEDNYPGTVTFMETPFAAGMKLNEGSGTFMTNIYKDNVQSWETCILVLTFQTLHSSKMQCKDVGSDSKYLSRALSMGILVWKVSQIL